MAHRLDDPDKAGLPQAQGQGQSQRADRRRGSHTDRHRDSLKTGSDGVEDGKDALDKGLKEADLPECAICLQNCIHPVKLPCSHIFCFLCMKGVAIQSKRCALCRQDIPIDFFNNPSLLRRDDLLQENSFEGGYQWFYQGINGWWQFDERTSVEVEEQYKTGDKMFEICIAGFLYVVDFENMLQYRRNDPSRRRKIKRDLSSIPDKKGVAGLKINPRAVPPPNRREADGVENISGDVQQTSLTVPSQTLSGSDNTPDANSSMPPDSAQDTGVAVSDSPQSPVSTGDEAQEHTESSSPSHVDLLSLHMAGMSLRSRHVLQNQIPRRRKHEGTRQRRDLIGRSPDTDSDSDDWE